MLFKTNMVNSLISISLGELDQSMSHQKRFDMDDKGKHPNRFVDVEEDSEI